MSLTKGKFKVGRVRFISEIIIDDPWRKVPEAEIVGYVPHASQSANEHDANTEDPAYHVSVSPRFSKSHPHTNTLSSPTHRSHQAQSPASTNLTPIPSPPRPPSSTLPNFPHATSSNPSSLRSSQTPPSSLLPRTLTPPQTRFRRRTEFT